VSFQEQQLLEAPISTKDCAAFGDALEIDWGENNHFFGCWRTARKDF
jgi:hypothetical protein